MLDRYKMNLLEQKLASFTEPQKAQAAGIYPYFRKIESDQDTEVVIDGRKVLMFGSNSYLGLTNHPRDQGSCYRRYGEVWYGMCR